ncbi:hypothetical protein ACH4PU_30445 [Streptomyces sp. NPDC021100]|uniref:hypothetical protein n=1 Tax=Streptomyces sp. NPDC021100 TaxID=3365114 RepID=UPI0037ABCA54
MTDPSHILETAHWIAHAAPYLAGVVLVVGGTALVMALQRGRRVQHALGRRTRVELVPTSTFDPGLGEISRSAQHLGRVRYAAPHVPARGAAARLRYSAENGQMRCYLEGPDTAAAVLRMPSHAEVEVRSASSSASQLQPVRFVIPDQRGEQR